MILDPEQVLALKKLTEQDEKSKKQELGASNLHASEDLKISLYKMDVDERIKKIILHFSDIFVPLPPPGSVKKLVTMDLELKENFSKIEFDVDRTQHQKMTWLRLLAKSKNSWRPVWFTSTKRRTILSIAVHASW